MKALLQRGWQWALGFFLVHAPQSSTRAISVILALTGCCVAMAAAYIGITKPNAHETIQALALIVTAVVSSGAVAIIVRSKPADGMQRDPRAADQKPDPDAS